MNNENWHFTIAIHLFNLVNCYKFYIDVYTDNKLISEISMPVDVEVCSGEEECGKPYQLDPLDDYR